MKSKYKKIMMEYTGIVEAYNHVKTLDIGYLPANDKADSNSVNIHWGNFNQKVHINSGADAKHLVDMAIKERFTVIRVKTNPWVMPKVIISRIQAEVNRASKEGKDIKLVIKA